MRISTICDKIEVCNENLLTLDNIVENLDIFFLGLLICHLKLNEIKEKIKNIIFSSKVFDINKWKEFIEEEILKFIINKNIKKSCRKIIIINFLADSDLKTFIETFKYINLSTNTIEIIDDVKDVVSSIKSESLISRFKT